MLETARSSCLGRPSFEPTSAAVAVAVAVATGIQASTTVTAFAGFAADLLGYSQPEYY